jgi:hypothetical protein
MMVRAGYMPTPWLKNLGIKKLPIELKRRDDYLSYLTFEKPQVNKFFKKQIIVEEAFPSKIIAKENQNYSVFMNDMQLTKRQQYTTPARYCIFEIFDKNLSVFIDPQRKYEVFKQIKKSNIRFLEGINNDDYFLAPIIQTVEQSKPTDFMYIINTPSYYATDTNAKVDGVAIKHSSQKELLEKQTLFYHHISPGYKGYIKNVHGILRYQTIIDKDLPRTYGY